LSGSTGNTSTWSAPEPYADFVQDDGPGIAAAEREQVHDPFYRTPRSGGDGCGLGLTIAREIAARHGARLLIRDHAPQGTRVEVIFGSGQAASA
jgi:signal transduction histidine kinase